MRMLRCRKLLAVVAAALFTQASAQSAQQVPAAGKASPALAVSRVFRFDQMPTRTMANGGESRDIVHGTLASGETLNLHESMQPGGATANPMHIIQHSELILVREGELEFQHEEGGQIFTERVGAGGVIYVAVGTKHTVRNAGAESASYFVLAIGGDAK